MKTRLLALAAAISTISMLTACGGGGGGPDSYKGADPLPVVPTVPATAPTVTVTAPETATAGYAFTAGWTSTDATSCSAGNLSSVTDATASFSKTEADVGTKTYSVTCTGAGGSATGTATVIVSAAPTAEGAWNGTTDDNRNFVGVVLAPDATTGKSAYWLGYSTSDADANNRTPAGFIVGDGASAPNYSDTTATSGAFTSSNLKEFNFTGGRVNASGSLTTPYVKKLTMGTASATGTFKDYDSDTNPTYPISYTVTSVITPENNTLGDPILFTTNVPMTGTATFSSAGVLMLSVSGSLQMDATALAGPTYLANAEVLAQTFRFNTTTDSSGTHLVPSSASTGTLSDTDTYVTTTQCVDAGAVLYPICPPAVSKVPLAPLNTKYPLSDGGIPSGLIPSYYTDQTIDPTAGVNSIKAGAAISDILGYEFTFSLSRSGVAATTRTFSSVYSPGYESTPSLATVAGSYNASPAYTGIDTAMYTNTTTFSISSSGAITGAESTSGCSYTATIAPHATGNVYDVTALNFTGGSCVYKTSGTFTGAATYDATAKKLTLTALDSTRSKGFMVVAAQP